MLEHHLRPIYQKVFISPIIHALDCKSVQPILVTFLGCLFGILTVPFIVIGYQKIAFFLLLLSGYLDTLDGSLARHLKLTSPLGASLDIICDRVVEFSLILGLYLVEPLERGLLSILMLGSILLCITTFLVVGIFTPNRDKKSFHYSQGLMERAEAFIFFSLLIFFPTKFTVLSLLFVCLVCYTAFYRCLQFARHQANYSNNH